MEKKLDELMLEEIGDELGGDQPEETPEDESSAFKLLNRIMGKANAKNPKLQIEICHSLIDNMHNLIKDAPQLQAEYKKMLKNRNQN